MRDVKILVVRNTIFLILTQPKKGHAHVTFELGLST